MAQIQGFRIRNYKALRDITLGKLWNTQNEEALTPLTAVIGKNGLETKVPVALDEQEISAIQESADVLKGVLEQMGLC